MGVSLVSNSYPRDVIEVNCAFGDVLFMVAVIIFLGIEIRNDAINNGQDLAPVSRLSSPLTESSSFQQTCQRGYMRRTMAMPRTASSIHSTRQDLAINHPREFIYIPPPNVRSTTFLQNRTTTIENETAGNAKLSAKTAG